MFPGSTHEVKAVKVCSTKRAGGHYKCAYLLLKTIPRSPPISTIILEAHSHGVDAAGDGITGLHLAVTQKFDGILLDLNLPGMDGMTFAESCGRKRITIRLF